ncbi:hypothetical protein A2U01_0110816, partial [Trifolium medium]|nr:hypothetical protein [Trifolium medium]
QPVIGTKLGWLLEPWGEWYPHDIAGKRTARRVFVAPDWGTRRRVVVLRRRVATVSSASTKGVA